MQLHKLCKYGFLGGIIYPTGYIIYNNFIDNKQTNINLYNLTANIICLSNEGFWNGIIAYIVYDTCSNTINYLKQIGSSQ